MCTVKLVDQQPHRPLKSENVKEGKGVTKKKKWLTPLFQCDVLEVL